MSNEILPPKDPIDPMMATLEANRINPQTENWCTACDAIKDVHRRLTLSDAEGNVISSSEFCQDCWKSGIRDAFVGVLLCGDELE